MNDNLISKQSHAQNSRLRLRERAQPQANRCSLYAHNPHLVCAIHPNGVDSDRCMDFRLDPNTEIKEQGRPQGYSWYGDELIIDRPSRFSQSVRTNRDFRYSSFLYALFAEDADTYFDNDNLPVHFDCPNCDQD